jgi:hypothetical protein
MRNFYVLIFIFLNKKEKDKILSGLARSMGLKFQNLPFF